MRRTSVAWLSMACVLGCADKQPVHRGVVWTDSEGRPIEGEQPRKRSAAGAQYGSSAQEPYVPRLRCMDGTLSPSCSPNSMRGDCCASQGGIYRDTWGNLVFE